ncbi:hypothetical protein Nepgr_010027 [Nepenthes gracilis]|uniref:BHLH domain-containing protein n=1 Tax=Nepenthes gracilis TaxID=150966 RepID=A0AAD3XKP1_NEPGR|nr:hypothetical protein Nepgr_010027 [Nepenthes gracilis]
MDSYMENPFHQRHQSQIPNSGFLRFRSAPSSSLSTIRDSLDIEDNYNQSPRFLTSACRGGAAADDSFKTVECRPIQRSGYSDFSSQMIEEQSQLAPQHPKQRVVATLGAVQGSHKLDGSVAMGHSVTGKLVGVSNLGMQSSSPAGFFAHLNTQNGYNMMGGVENFRVENGTSEEVNWLNRQIDFASRLSSPSLLPQIPLIGNEKGKETSLDGAKFKNGEGNAPFYSPRLSFTSWNDSAGQVENIFKRGGDEWKNCVSYSCSNASIAQNGRLENQTRVLSHHLSLPRTINGVEKLVGFNNIVPCRTRAKRGCATHPRSIAERVRRARISERMKKLQKLIPNMEKQMNTSEMLDYLSEYIKDLQEQCKVLSDNRAKCKCLNRQ